MATILFAAAGASFGAGFGGSILGLSGAVIGRAVGATLGRAVDQRILGLGSQSVEVGRLDRIGVMGASEGTAIPRLWGRARIPGQVIWAAPFKEARTVTSRGGKGGSRGTTTEFSYSLSFAVALCEGKILGVGRVWADGTEISIEKLNCRIYYGDEAQSPDPAIEADTGFGNAPAYRGLAYIVFEDLNLSEYGNRVPQLQFEVIRAPEREKGRRSSTLQDVICGVAMIPGTGEYALATQAVSVDLGLGRRKTLNVNSNAAGTDFSTSLQQISVELPNCKSISLVVSWFGDDLRCDHCHIQPKVENLGPDPEKMPWMAGGIGRTQAITVPNDNGLVYGGTPSDQSVLQAIQALRSAGKSVMFYPFVLMDQIGGNLLPDPYADSGSQPALPWRGRITLPIAPGRMGSSDGTPAAVSQVEQFFGAASVEDFAVTGGTVHYNGPDEWSYRRFILHYAFLCQVSGGVDAFCVGSELRGLTRIRGASHSFPAVSELIRLASDVRQILGPITKISYAADWSEYFGYQVSGNQYYNLDQLWASPDVDFIGIDNYFPISDWRPAARNSDADYGSQYNLEYLKDNILGGENFDWYYDGDEGVEFQNRRPIRDEEYGEDWIFKSKDIPSWWGNAHHERIDGVRSPLPTAWIPRSKPIRFTEFGCPAVDLGGNEPNKFLDARSSESALPRFSSGARDDYMQLQYFRAVATFWSDSMINEVSEIYGGPMLDLENSFAWAWDARPFPSFPRYAELWGDSQNYYRGHWLNGRASNIPLDAVVEEVFATVGIYDVDTSMLHGFLRGYTAQESLSARSILQALSATYAFDICEDEGIFKCISRGGRDFVSFGSDQTIATSGASGEIEKARQIQSASNGSVRFGFITAEDDFLQSVSEVSFPEDNDHVLIQQEFPILLTTSEAKSIATRWLVEADASADSINLELPLSLSDIGVGQQVRFDSESYRVDRIEVTNALSIVASRIVPGIYGLGETDVDQRPFDPFIADAGCHSVWMDLPSLRSSDTAFSPYIAISAVPWTGAVAVWSSADDSDYKLVRSIEVPTLIGVSEIDLLPARPGVIDRGSPLRIKIGDGHLSSVQLLAMLNGANALAIGDGSADRWEIIQFKEAQMIGPDRFELSARLRGQLGSDYLSDHVWPSGSVCVLLDSSVGQISYDLGTRGLSRNYIIGRASNGYDGDEVSRDAIAFHGNGLRPYRVCHLRARRDLGGNLKISWTRRTRTDGDNWNAMEVPLGEEREAYLVTISSISGVFSRSLTLTEPQLTYLAGDLLAEGASFPLQISVAQLSTAFGPGPARTVIAT
jgi:hypothetical protein